MKKSIIFLSFLSIFLFFSAFSASAGSFNSVRNYVLEANETADKNLYVSGNTINVLGQTGGDLIGAGGNIFFSGSVLGDIAIAGGTIDCRGKTEGDLRIAGGNLNIGGNVGGEVIALGGNISIISGSDIKGDVFIAGGNIIIDGKIGGNLEVLGGTIQINGIILGNVDIKKAETISFGEGTVIGGTLDYSSPKEAVISKDAKISGKINFKKLEPKVDLSKNAKDKSENKKIKMAGILGFLGSMWLLKLLMIITAAFVFYLLFLKNIQKSVQYSISKFWIEMLRGFVILIVIPAAIIISFISVIGTVVGIIGLCLYAIFVLLAVVYGMILAGSLASKYIFKESEYKVNWKTVIIGVLLLWVAGLIPFIGWIISFAFFLVAFGSLFNFLHQYFKKA